MFIEVSPWEVPRWDLWKRLNKSWDPTVHIKLARYPDTRHNMALVERAYTLFELGARKWLD